MLNTLNYIYVSHINTNSNLHNYNQSINAAKKNFLSQFIYNLYKYFQ
jgi:hypothetical protein